LEQIIGLTLCVCPSRAHSGKARNAQRKGAKTQRRKEDLAGASSSQRTVSDCQKANSACRPCAFAPRRLCVKSVMLGCG